MSLSQIAGVKKLYYLATKANATLIVMLKPQQKTLNEFLKLSIKNFFHYTCLNISVILKLIPALVYCRIQKIIIDTLLQKARLFLWTNFANLVNRFSTQ